MATFQELQSQIECCCLLCGTKCKLTHCFACREENRNNNACVCGCNPACMYATEQIQVVQLRPGGTLGTQLWPLSVDLHKTVASLVGRLCATLIAGMASLMLLSLADTCAAHIAKRGTTYFRSWKTVPKARFS